MRIAALAAAVTAWMNGRGRFANDAGASLLEYALVLGLVGVVAFAALMLLGTQTLQSLSTSAGSISS
jgi:Flp pilus assembly pilin Flp